MELLVDDQVIDAATQALFGLAEEVGDLVGAGHQEHGELVLLRNGAAEELEVFFLGNHEVGAFLDFANHVGIGQKSAGLLLEGGKVGLGVLLDRFKAERTTAFLEGFAYTAECEYAEHDQDKGNDEGPIVGEKI